jgi:hypothetical protein
MRGLRFFRWNTPGGLSRTGQRTVRTPDGKVFLPVVVPTFTDAIDFAFLADLVSKDGFGRCLVTLPALVGGESVTKGKRDPTWAVKWVWSDHRSLLGPGQPHMPENVSIADVEVYASGWSPDPATLGPGAVATVLPLGVRSNRVFESLGRFARPPGIGLGVRVDCRESAAGRFPYTPTNDCSRTLRFSRARVDSIVQRDAFLAGLFISAAVALLLEILFLLLEPRRIEAGPDQLT